MTSIVVDAPAGWTLTIGHTLPAGTPVAGVVLDDVPVDYAIHDTIRGREVRVETTSGTPRRLIVTVGSPALNAKAARDGLTRS